MTARFARVFPLAGLSTFVSVLTTIIAAADPSYPSSPVRLVVPWSAGGASDTASRAAEQPLSRALGAKIYIENRPGGSGISGMLSALQSKPDGYTIVLGAMPNVALFPAIKDVKYDVAKDLVPLGMIWDSPHVFAVNAGTGIDSLGSYIARAKAAPGQITVGAGGGTGSATHMSNLLLQREAKIKLLSVPYTATAGAVLDLLGGRTESIFGDVALLTPHIKKEGSVMKPIGIAAMRRSFLLPDLPTMGELRLPGVVSGNWYGLFVSSQVPADIRAQLQAAVLTMQNDPAYIEALAKNGIEIHHKGADALARFVQAQIGLWPAVVKEFGITF